MLALNSTGGNSSFWNYTNQNKPTYSPTLEGTIVQIAEVQKQERDKTTGQWIGATWQDGNPILQFRFTILNAVTGQDTIFDFSRGKNSQMIKAIEAAMPESQDLEDMAGKYVRITTPPGVYNAQNPRPYTVEILGENPGLYRGTVYWGQQQPQAAPQVQGYTQQGVQGNPQMPQGYQVQPQQQQFQQQQPVPVQQYQQPAQYQQPVQQVAQPVQQPVQYQQAQAQPVQQAVPQQQQPIAQPQQAQPMPQQVQQQPVQQAQPVEQGTTAYDEVIPF